MITARIDANRAWAGFAHVAANVAESYFFLDFGDGVDQGLRFLVGCVEQVEGDALRTFRPDAGQVGERVDVPLIVEILLLLHVARVFGVVGAEILDFFHFE